MVWDSASVRQNPWNEGCKNAPFKSDGFHKTNGTHTTIVTESFWESWNLHAMMTQAWTYSNWVSAMLTLQATVLSMLDLRWENLQNFSIVRTLATISALTTTY